MKVVFNTKGDGFWTSKRLAVEIVDMQLGYIDDELDFGELRIYFDTKTWDIRKDGLIYGDSQFFEDLTNFLVKHKLGLDVSYSEQGMQGDDYVSCDVGPKFLKSWAAKFGQLVVVD